MENIKTSTEIVYNKIKTKILTCEYIPGQLLSEKEIVDELDTSRTPVREALSMLNGQRLIKIIYNKGIQISPLSAKRVREVYELRRVLEPLSVKYAIKYIKQNDIDNLFELDENLGISVDNEDVLNIFKYGMDIHVYIAKLANHETLLEHIKILRDESYRSQVFYLKKYLDICSETEKIRILAPLRGGHKNLTLALSERDEKKAIKYLLEDLNSINDTIANI